MLTRLIIVLLAILGIFFIPRIVYNIVYRIDRLNLDHPEEMTFLEMWSVGILTLIIVFFVGMALLGMSIYVIYGK